MDEWKAVDLLERLGCRPRVRGTQIEAKCPFPDNHKRGDKRPSFGAKIDNDKWSPFFCHACHAKGMLEQLAIENGMSHLVEGWRPKSVGGGEWMKPVARKPVEATVFFDDKYLAPFVGMLSGRIRKRGILIDTAKAWELGIDKENVRATFTVRDYAGRLGVLIGRDVRKTPHRIKYSNYLYDKREDRMVPFRCYTRMHFDESEYISPTKSHFLYGEHLAVKRIEETTDLVVVEGPVDTLKTWQSGVNAVGTLGSYVSDRQMGKIKMLVPKGGKLIVMFDGDKAGREATAELRKKLSNRISLYSVNLKDGMDPGGMSEDDIRDAVASAKRLT